MTTGAWCIQCTTAPSKRQGGIYMNINETQAAIVRLLERANARQLSLILRMVRVVVGEGEKA